MVLTKQELTAKQRSTLELLQYLTIMGPALIEAAQAGGFDPAAWTVKENGAKALDFDQTLAAIGAQNERYGSLLGAIAGTLLAWWATRAAASLSLPLPIPLVFDLQIDERVLLFTLFASLVAGVLAGLAPAIQASRPSLLADLRGEQVVSRGPAWLGGHRLMQRDILVAGQIAGGGRDRECADEQGS